MGNQTVDGPHWDILCKSMGSIHGLVTHTHTHILTFSLSQYSPLYCMSVNTHVLPGLGLKINSNILSNSSDIFFSNQ